MLRQNKLECSTLQALWTHSNLGEGRSFPHAKCILRSSSQKIAKNKRSYSSKSYSSSVSVTKKKEKSFKSYLQSGL